MVLVCLKSWLDFGYNIYIKIYGVRMEDDFFDDDVDDKAMMTREAELEKERFKTV
jgi:hypothetical protein